MAKAFALFIFVVAILVSQNTGNVMRLQGCGGRVFVDEAVVIDAPLRADCVWEFETQEDRILVVSIVNGNLNDAEEYFSIYDGTDSDSPILRVENQKIHEVSRKDLPQSVYTTLPEASIRFRKTPTSNLQLRIQKAVPCPFNLGLDSQCGRVVDELSCYCATFTNRVQTDQTMYCIDNNMKLISFENATEEQIIQSTWGTQVEYWTSLTDTRREGTWLWESSMTVPVYTNWAPARPDPYDTNIDDCMIYGGIRFLTFWGDIKCVTMARAICEAQP
uniref:C-type lectin ctl-mannose binding n=2 Tax=Daphnia magna TaxID=35525 RepID=A0A0P5WBP0_9CRUS